MNSWHIELIQELTDEYGTVPPPYVIIEAHPVSMAWRMGYGEDFMHFWYEWIEKQNWDKSEKISYFQQFKPPYAWLEWVLFCLYPTLSDEYYKKESEEEMMAFIKPHFAELEALGFGSFDDWFEDYNSDRWD